MIPLRHLQRLHRVEDALSSAHHHQLRPTLPNPRHTRGSALRTSGKPGYLGGDAGHARQAHLRRRNQRDRYHELLSQSGGDVGDLLLQGLRAFEVHSERHLDVLHSLDALLEVGQVQAVDVIRSLGITSLDLCGLVGDALHLLGHAFEAVAVRASVLQLLKDLQRAARLLDRLLVVAGGQRVASRCLGRSGITEGLRSGGGRRLDTLHQVGKLLADICLARKRVVEVLG